MIGPQAASIAPPLGESSDDAKRRVKPDKCLCSIIPFYLASKPWPGLQARDMHHQGPIISQLQPCRALTEERDAYTEPV